MKNRFAGAGCAVVVAFGLWLATVQHAMAQGFEKGTTSATLMLGAGQALGQSYTIISGRLGYYFVRDFEAAVGFEAWRGNDPLIYKVIPELRYVYSASKPFKPYLSIFVSRTVYQGNGTPDDVNTYGGKAGLYFPLNPNAYFGLGIIYERIESCDPAVYRDCSQTYPEGSLHFLF